MIEILDEDLLFEMANVSTEDTKLPYELWIDSAGSERNVNHNSPRIKVNVDGDMIPVSISDNPKVLVSGKDNFKGKSEITKYIKKYLDVFIKHWNKELTDKEALNLLGEK